MVFMIIIYIPSQVCYSHILFKRFALMFRQLTPTVLLDYQECRMYSYVVRTQQYIYYIDQLHVSTKHGHYQVGLCIYFYVLYVMH